jgi:uncharacterized caspase-like protein
MWDIRYLLKKKYTNSRALVIGINKYKHTSPLSFAVNDAEGFKNTLIDTLGFEEKNITLLLDDAATKSAIFTNYMRLAREDVELDERVIVFFAGHGHTQSGHRGEVGFLVPSDANMDDLATLIRWKDLTEYSDLIKAKHMLFIMDACYGGLALTRSVQAGSARFLNDMLLRRSRQVLTAGKANEEVSDADGPIAGHSIFTGHLLEGLRGKAVPESGVLTAAALMSYVYANVSNDPHSEQSPHYGHFDGDGDFVLLAPSLSQSDVDEAQEIDRLLIVPHVEEVLQPATTYEKTKRVKTLLSNDASSIELHDVVVEEVRRFLSLSDVANFPVMAIQSDEEIASRVSRYDEIATDLALSAACISYWGKSVHASLLQKIFSRSTDNLDMISGSSTWLALRNYPTVVQTYYAGIAAIEEKRYDSLRLIFGSPVGSEEYGKQNQVLSDHLLAGILEMNRANIFKKLPGHANNRVPMSEHLFKVLQPKLDDVFFIGRNYESAFDEFEILLSLICIDTRLQNQQAAWGPIGRFGWKAYGGGGNPLMKIIDQAKLQGASWPPLLAGLFGGAPERLEKATTELRDNVARLNWH